MIVYHSLKSLRKQFDRLESISTNVGRAEWDKPRLYICFTIPKFCLSVNIMRSKDSISNIDIATYDNRIVKSFDIPSLYYSETCRNPHFNHRRQIMFIELYGCGYVSYSNKLLVLINFSDPSKIRCHFHESKLPSPRGEINQSSFDEVLKILDESFNEFERQGKRIVCRLNHISFVSSTTSTNFLSHKFNKGLLVDQFLNFFNKEFEFKFSFGVRNQYCVLAGENEIKVFDIVHQQFITIFTKLDKDLKMDSDRFLWSQSSMKLILVFQKTSNRYIKTFQFSFRHNQLVSNQIETTLTDHQILTQKNSQFDYCCATDSMVVTQLDNFANTQCLIN